MKTLEKPIIHIINFIFVTLAIVFTFTSCSSDEDPSIQSVDDNNLEYALLISTLNNYSS